LRGTRAARLLPQLGVLSDDASCRAYPQSFAAAQGIGDRARRQRPTPGRAEQCFDRDIAAGVSGPVRATAIAVRG
jgi:hypothetical protein